MNEMQIAGLALAIATFAILGGGLYYAYSLTNKK